MADINKIKLPSGAEYNIKDYRIPGVDTTPTSGSDNVITSGGVRSAIDTAISSVYRVKGTKATYTELPSSGNVAGDVWNITAAYGNYPPGTNWVWTGSAWDALGGEIDLSGKQAVTSVTVSGSGNAVTNATFSNKALTLTKGNIATPGTLTTTSTTALSTASNEALSGSISLHKVAKTGTYSDLIGKPTIPAAPGTLNTNNTTAQTASSSEALSGTINLHKVAKTGTYSDLIGTPTIPAAQVQSDWNATSGMGVILNKPTIPTTLDQITDGSTRKLANYLPLSGGVMSADAEINIYDSGDPEDFEASTNIYTGSIEVYGQSGDGEFSGGNIAIHGVNGGHAELYASSNDANLTLYPGYETNNTLILRHDGFTHGVGSTEKTWSFPSQSGTFALASDIPSAVTESTVSGWGFTKNSGTITGITMNGASKGTSGVVDLGTVLTSETALSKGTTSGSGNAVTDISVSGHTITLTKGSTFLTSETSLSKGTTTGSGNAVTDISVNGHQITLTKGSTFLTSETSLSKGSDSGSGNVVTDISVSNHQITLTKSSTVPVATSANAGKIPRITSSGAWEYVTPSAIYSGSGTPSNGTGNNGDVYLQTS